MNHCYPLPFPGPVYLTISQGDQRYLPASSGGVAYLTKDEADTLYLPLGDYDDFLTRDEADALYVPLETLPSLLTVSQGDTRYAPVGSLGGITVGYGAATFFEDDALALTLQPGQGIFRQQINLQVGDASYRATVALNKNNAVAGCAVELIFNFPANSANPRVLVASEDGELYSEDGQNNSFVYSSKITAVYNGSQWNIW
jgi:hypothetical protein